MSVKFPRGGGAGPFLARSLLSEHEDRLQLAHAGGFDDGLQLARRKQQAVQVPR